MALIDELKAKTPKIAARRVEALSEIERQRQIVGEAEMELRDLDIAIAALEAPAQPVHPEAELRSVPGAEEMSGDQIGAYIERPWSLITAFRDGYEGRKHVAPDHPVYMQEWLAGDNARLEEMAESVERAHATLDAIARMNAMDNPDRFECASDEPEIPPGFTKWEGGRRPIESGTRIEAITANGHISTWVTNDEIEDEQVNWELDGSDLDIIAYRIIEAPEPEIPAGFTRWEGGEWTGLPTDRVQVIFCDEPTPYFPTEAENLDPLWCWERCPPDAQRIIAYRVVEASFSEQDALAEFMKLPGAVKWEGGECPVPQSAVVEYLLRGADLPPLDPKPAFLLSWDHADILGDIIAYRVVSEPAEQYDDPTAVAIAAYIEAENEAPAPEQDALAEFMKLPGAVKWDGSREPPVARKTEVEVFYWEHGIEGIRSGEAADRDWSIVLAYRIIEAPALEQDASEAINDLVDELVGDITFTADTVAVQTYMDGDRAVIREISAEEMYAPPPTDLWQQGYDDKANGYEPSLAEPEYTKGYEARALIEREHRETMERAKFFDGGMMADADRHQSDQRGIVGVLTGMFKQKENA